MSARVDFERKLLVRKGNVCTPVVVGGAFHSSKSVLSKIESQVRQTLTPMVFPEKEHRTKLDIKMPIESYEPRVEVYEPSIEFYEPPADYDHPIEVYEATLVPQIEQQVIEAQLQLSSDEEGDEHEIEEQAEHVSHEVMEPLNFPEPEATPPPVPPRKKRAAVELTLEQVIADEVERLSLQDESIKWHNYYRAKHGVAQLRFSSSLAQIARKAAKALAAGSDIKLASYSFNVFYYPSKEYKNGSELAFKAVSTWYQRSKQEMAQIIWSASERLGVGKAVNSVSDHVIVVAVYEPRANFRDFDSNVFPLVI